MCEGLRAQIRELWDRLQIPAEEREAVATVMTGSKAKVRKAVRNPMGAGLAVSTSVKSAVLTSFLPRASLFLRQASDEGGGGHSSVLYGAFLRFLVPRPHC